MRIKITNLFYIFLGLIGFNAGQAVAADNIFLCIEGLEGESQDARYTGCIDVLAWSWGASVSIDRVSGGGAGKASFQDLSVTKTVDKASVGLMLHLAKGAVFPKVQMFVDNCTTECTNSAYYKLTMEDVLVSSVALGGSQGADRPTEQVAFNYTKIQWCYSTIDGKGQLGEPDCEGWNLELNEPYNP